MIFDTSDIREGIVIGQKHAVPPDQIGSAKKRFEHGDVLISRLRPYLRQVAYVDKAVGDGSAGLICSTEFFVLRSRSGQSIAFLVPYLLSSPVQSVLAASQEGGHHPRFSEETLMELTVSESVLAVRDDTSSAIEKACRSYRKSEGLIATAVQLADKALT